MSVVSGSKITRFEKNQFAAARLMLGRAFFDYPLFEYAVPHTGRRSRGVTALYAAILRDALRHGEVYTTANTEGAACWLPPGLPLPTFIREVRAGMLGLPFAFGFGAFRLLLEYDHVARDLHQEFASGPHWFLATIGVDPARQGQGLGSALMEPVLAKADAGKTPCYLETHRPDNVRLYERHGFEVVRFREMPGHPVPVWAMLRQPRNS